VIPRSICSTIVFSLVVTGCEQPANLSDGAGNRVETVVVENFREPPAVESFALPGAGGADAVYDISVDDPDELRLLLVRLEQLARRPRSQHELPEIALVLHGPEVELFAIENYPQNRDVVDLAAKLDALKIIEVKMCQTRMRSLGLDNEDIPGFIELVPFGPGEVERLTGEGYITM